MHIALNAHLLSGSAGYRSAGIHQYMHHVLANLPAHLPPDWRMTVLAGAQLDTDYAPLTVRRSPMNTERPLSRIAWEQAVQPLTLLRGGFDGYHAMAFVAPVASRLPLVATVYDLSFVHYPDRLPRARRAYLMAMGRHTCQRARRLLTISHATARDLTETWDIAPERIDVAAPGCDRARFRPLADDEQAAFRAAHDLPDRFWLFIGTLEPRKNLVTLLEAYARLNASDRLPLVIGGGRGWDYAPIFEAVERLKLSEQVRFTGFIPADDLPFWYNCAETFIYPSVFEGFGLPVLEAMACGTPVITSDTSSLPEVAQGAGHLVAPYDVQAWSDAMGMAASDGVWRREARAAGLQEAARYTWDDAARITAACYQKAFGTSL
jgi:glycosyltransferase involved in cell wall biosynthesis